MTKKQKIQEGLIDRIFNALEMGVEKNRKKANAKAMKDPKVQRRLKNIKKEIDRLSKDIDDRLGI